jgi:hypothetical protein
MSFNPSIPNIGDFLAISQKQLLANYQAIATSFGQNHIGLGTENQGQHNSLTLRPQNADPATSATQSALYNKLIAGVPQLFFRSSNSPTPVQMTNSNSSVINTAGVTYRQSSFLAGPFTIYTGFIINAVNGSTVMLTPNTTLRYVGVTLLNPGSQINQFPAVATNIAGNTFQIHFGLVLGTPTLYYMAIGS